MNFEMAQELAEMEGIEVASVVVDDDIAVENSLYTQGRRCCRNHSRTQDSGHAAELGKSLAEIKELADKPFLTLKQSDLPFQVLLSLKLENQALSLTKMNLNMGLGIHGEPDTKRKTPIF
nr:dihydroxyacetone kinase subunit DhaK [Streptococcus sp. O1]